MPEIADTAHGPVEYETLGKGAPVLVVHGTPGGYDQGLAMAGVLPPDDFRAIVVSRPGYLGTGMDGRESVDEQADLLAALLDVLEVERVGVLCWSGGGPSSYRLAARHPERVGSLVALAAVSKRLEQPKEDLPTRLLFSTRPGDWLLRAMAAHAPKQLISSTLASEGDLTKEQLPRMRQSRGGGSRPSMVAMPPTASEGLYVLEPGRPVRPSLGRTSLNDVEQPPAGPRRSHKSRLRDALARVHRSIAIDREVDLLVGNGPARYPRLDGERSVAPTASSP